MYKGEILVVMEHTPEQREHIDSLVVEGYDVTAARGSSEAMRAVKARPFGLVIADLSSKGVDSLNFLALYKDKNPLGKIITLSKKASFRSLLQAIKNSSFDHLFEPVPRDFFLRSVELAFQESERATTRFRAQVAEENVRLKEELEKSNLETIMALAGALEARDCYTRGHSFRVSEMAVRVGERMGLTTDEIRKLRYGGILHDIGKIGVDASILNKSGPLTKDDMDAIRRHADIGVKIVSKVESLKGIIPIIQHHHEPYAHLKTMVEEGTSDHLLISAIKVVDAYDAMVSDRPYRNALPGKMAITELVRYAGTEFHPGVVEEVVMVIRWDSLKELGSQKPRALFDESGAALRFR